MAYGYQRVDPREVFRSSVKYWKELIEIAMEEGFTREEAMQLLIVDQLDAIRDVIGSIN